MNYEEFKQSLLEPQPEPKMESGEDELFGFGGDDALDELGTLDGEATPTFPSELKEPAPKKDLGMLIFGASFGLMIGVIGFFWIVGGDEEAAAETPAVENVAESEELATEKAKASFQHNLPPAIDFEY